MSNQQLILRSNRFLAAKLLENRLISSEDVEQANAKLLSYFQSGKMHYASVLRILVHDLKVLDESNLIRILVNKYKVGLMHLGHTNMAVLAKESLDMDECWSTMTMPFDKIGNAVCVATCYYLSRPVVELWEQKYSYVLWYTTSIDSMTSALEALSKEKVDETIS